MKKILLIALATILATAAFGQSPAKYWVAFTDKKGTPYSIDKPEAFLSPRAIELRKAHGIAIDESDLPVNPDYVRQVLALDTAARCFTTSKWHNGMTVYALREDMQEAIERLPFVDSVERTDVPKDTLLPPWKPADVFPGRYEAMQESTIVPWVCLRIGSFSGCTKLRAPSSRWSSRKILKHEMVSMFSKPPSRTIICIPSPRKPMRCNHCTLFTRTCLAASP